MKKPGIIWKVSDTAYMGTVDCIRAESMDDANDIYNERHPGKHATMFQPFEDGVHVYAVYFTDNPRQPAFFKGTLTEVNAAARLYIRQWQLDATIARIEEI